MNIILISDDDYLKKDVVVLKERRALHVIDVLKSKVGESVHVGKINDKLGVGVITKIKEGSVELKVQLTQTPPPPIPITLVLALPRPKSLRKALQGAISLGVKTIYLINSYRVEKSFWESSELHKEVLYNQIVLALEQAKDTVFPQVIFKRKFKPFVEDELPELVKGAKGFVAHPEAKVACPSNLKKPIVLVIGPEGGFVDYEIDLFKKIKFQPVSLGARPLRVETAIASLVGRLM